MLLADTECPSLIFFHWFLHHWNDIFTIIAGFESFLVSSFHKCFKVSICESLFNVWVSSSSFCKEPVCDYLYLWLPPSVNAPIAIASIRDGECSIPVWECLHFRVTSSLSAFIYDGFIWSVGASICECLHLWVPPSVSASICECLHLWVSAFECECLHLLVHLWVLSLDQKCLL